MTQAEGASRMLEAVLRRTRGGDDTGIGEAMKLVSVLCRVIKA